MNFDMTEDDLTNAIFYNCTLETTGGGTKTEARQQARTMLRADRLATILELIVVRLQFVEDEAEGAGFPCAAILPDAEDLLSELGLNPRPRRASKLRILIPQA